MKISIIHATMGRPEKAVAARDMWFKQATKPCHIEYIFGTHLDDLTAPALRRISGMEQKQHYGTLFTDTNKRGSAANYAKAATLASGELLIQGQDDLEPPAFWDMELISRLEKECGAEWMHKRVFIAVSDGYRPDRLCITSIMTRPYFLFKREFICGDYPGLYADDENTYRAYRDQRDGNCQVIEARDLVFRHRHHYHDLSVPWDDTYCAENADESYQSGAKLFNERNPEAQKDGIKTW